MPEKTILRHQKARFEVRESPYDDIIFENGEKILEIATSKNGTHWTCITEFNRADLVELRSAIDEYLTKTAPIPNYD